jgi:UDP-glucose 4-epimerase
MLNKASTQSANLLFGEYSYMRALVTGGSGFIGSFLVDELVNEGYAVTILDTNSPKYGLHGKARFIYGDITSQNDVERAMQGQDVVFHLAGLLGTHELIEKALEATMVNIGGTIRILDACRKFDVRLVAISKPSCWVNPYTITKVAAEHYIEMYRREFGVQAVVLKWFNVYGGRQPLFESKGYRKAVPTWIMCALKGQPLEIYGTGGQTMDLVYVGDTIGATLAAVNHWSTCEGKTLEVGSGEETTANRLAEIIREFSESVSPLVHIPMRPGETEDTRIKADIKPLRDLAGWNPSVPISNGISETIEWYRRNILEDRRHS